MVTRPAVTAGAGPLLKRHYFSASEGTVVTVDQSPRIHRDFGRKRSPTHSPKQTGGRVTVYVSTSYLDGRSESHSYSWPYLAYGGEGEDSEIAYALSQAIPRDGVEVSDAERAKLIKR